MIAMSGRFSGCPFVKYKYEGKSYAAHIRTCEDDRKKMVMVNLNRLGMTFMILLVDLQIFTVLVQYMESMRRQSKEMYVMPLQIIVTMLVLQYSLWIKVILKYSSYIRSVEYHFFGAGCQMVG